MAEAEKKDVAKLDFNIGDALSSLTLVDNNLKSLAESSKKYAETISNNLKKGLDSSKLVNVSDVSKNLNVVANLSETSQKNLSAQLIKIEARKQASIEVETAKGEQKRQTLAYKSALKQEEYNNRVLKSTQTLYDQISQYAKTYVIYQGFNKLRQTITETVDEMVDLEYQMVQIDRVLNESSLDIDHYRDQLIQLASDYGNSFANVADVTLRLAQAGFDSQESLALTEKTLLALNTAELNATEATDDMVAIMAQWGLMTGNAAEEAQSYGEIVDKINKVADNFPTTSADVLDALKKMSSGFNLAGASIDETIALFVAAEQSSQRGGKAIGNALSNITQQLKDAGRLSIAESLGLDFYTDETKTEFKDIIDIFEQMSQKMQQLKDAGKENSVEMQNLLSIFTVFRRNIGSSLLGEMSGEDSTYLRALETSLNSVGYSLEENEKHMKTAKAAQAQFNAEILKLKTEFWDNGGEAFFRELLTFGTDLVKGIQTLVKNVGVLPTVLGTATLAFTTVNKSFEGFTFNSEKSSIEVSGFIKKIKEATEQVRNTNKGILTLADNQGVLITSNNNAVKSFAKNTLEVGKYSASLVLSTAKTIALEVATVALNAAISFGLSLAITAIVSALDSYINAEQKAIEKSKELMQTAQDTANEFQNQVDSINSLTDEYMKFSQSVGKDSKKIIDTDNITQALELEAKINEAIKDSGEQVKLVTEETDKQGQTVQKVNTQYDEQLSKIKAVAYEKKKQQVEELKNAADSARNLLTGVSSLEENNWGKLWNTNANTVEEALKTAGVSVDEFKQKVSGLDQETIENLPSFWTSFSELIKNLGFEEQKQYFTEWREALIAAKNDGKNVEGGLKIIEDALNELAEQEKVATQATEEYQSALAELYAMSGAVDEFSNSLQGIANEYNIKSVQNLVTELQKINTSFSSGKIDTKEYFDSLQSQIDKIDLSAYTDAVNKLKSEYSDVLKGAIKETEKTVENGQEEVTYMLTDTTENINSRLQELQDKINNVDLSGLSDEAKEELEAMQAIFAETTENLAQMISNIFTGFESGAINFSDYSEGILESGETALDLYTKINDLAQNSEGLWVDASGNVDTYANSLQSAQKELSTFSSLLTTIGDNYDYIAEHANAAGEAFFQASDVGTKAYENLANNMAASLQKMEKSNEAAYTAITNKVFEAMGTSANEVANADKYITDALNGNAQALNAALNESARQVSESTSKVTVAMGNVLSALGNAIANFDYSIQATPYISGFFGIHKDANGIPNGLSLPKFGFDITGSGGKSAQDLGAALNTFGSELSNLGTVSFRYNQLKNKVKPYTSSTPRGTTSSPVSTSPSTGSGGGGGGSSSSSSSSDRDAERAAQEQYNTRLDLWSSFVDYREKAEQRWVKKQKELGQLSNNDFLYITQQRISRYEDYLKELNSLTWLSQEDRLKLEQEYLDEIEDLKLEYFDYLKDILDEEIKALEDARDAEIDRIKELNDANIQAIKDEAQERIDALKKVEDENDRIRSKEEYYRKRQEHLTDISYWEQRTGREAQEALVQARKNLEELDREWQEQQEDWSIEDQIKAIEEQRDAQIKAIEEAEQAQIEAIEKETQKQIDELQRIYDERVKLFSESNKIIYDDTVIQSEALYKAYKENFVDPLREDLKQIVKQAQEVKASKTTSSSSSSSSSKPASSSSEQKYSTYKVKRGDTLSEIAQRYNTTVSKIMAANPSIKNKNLIYTGQTLKIPKFHTGGIFSGVDEGLAVLKRGEVVYKKEWADNIDRLAKMVKNSQTQTFAPSTQIEVKGDLVKIEADIKNKTDAEYLTRRIEKMLTDKFNIKK